jgi:ATP-binding cassette subfamily C protein CydD
MGESGIGKTTLIEVLGRFSSFIGTYSIDGVEYPFLTPSPFVAMMITPHDPFFKTTLRENITLGRPISDHHLRSLLHDICADFALDALDTIIGEGAISFSTGEEQRLRLARALLTTSDLLLLDEPLTGVDDETRAKILSHLPRLLAGRTVVIVSHREEEVCIANRVVRIGG